MRCRVTKPHLQSLGAVRVDWLLQDREACLNGAKILDAHVHCMACRQLLPRTAPRSPPGPRSPSKLSSESRAVAHAAGGEGTLLACTSQPQLRHVPRRYDAHTVGMLKEFSARMFALSTQPRGSVTRHKLGSSKHAPKKRTLRVKRAKKHSKGCRRRLLRLLRARHQALVAEVAKGVDLSGQILCAISSLRESQSLTFLGL